ncbi:MAG: hypothetical protein K2J99_11790 [Lachnospiraceae bacterium]|nr:hypothetical protein [Lachnospiraceae bacterium]
MKILFIGNSHTYYNDMPHMFADICREHHVDTEITMLAHAGKGWDFHVKEPEVRFNILYGGYDAVVLQHTAHPMGDLSVMAECGKKLIQWARDASARPVLYMTWTTKADGEAAQDTMSNAYRKLQQETGCELASVGDKWWEYHKAHPEVELYAVDGQHASKAGSQLAASIIAEVILKI